MYVICVAWQRATVMVIFPAFGYAEGFGEGVKVFITDLCGS